MKQILEYAMQWVGKPYKWGGSGPDGFDCSGFVLELLMSIGIAPPYDTTSQGLYNYYNVRGDIQNPTAGCLLFYGRSVNQITHVGMAIDSHRIIEAAGGGSKTKTVDDAIRDKAFVRIRPIYERDDFLVAIMPNYELEVL